MDTWTMGSTRNEVVSQLRSDFLVTQHTMIVWHQVKVRLHEAYLLVPNVKECHEVSLWLIVLIRPQNGNAYL